VFGDLRLRVSMLRDTSVATVDFAASRGDTVVVTPESRKVRVAYPLDGGIQNLR
jgi:hypothetical protein